MIKNLSAACSALSKIKLEVKYNDSECSPWLERIVPARTAFVSNFVLRDFFLFIIFLFSFLFLCTGGASWTKFTQKLVKDYIPLLKFFLKLYSHTKDISKK